MPCIDSLYAHFTRFQQESFFNFFDTLDGLEVRCSSAVGCCQHLTALLHSIRYGCIDSRGWSACYLWIRDVYRLECCWHQIACVTMRPCFVLAQNTRLVIPDAPMRRITVNHGEIMRGWYDIRSLNARGVDTSHQEVCFLDCRDFTCDAVDVSLSASCVVVLAHDC